MVGDELKVFALVDFLMVMPMYLRTASLVTVTSLFEAYNL